MEKIKVLLVDDSALVRKVVGDVLKSDEKFEVITPAQNGAIALTRIATTMPDVIILDVEMPEMDGLTALGKIREINKKVPIIMFSTLTESGAKVTIDALSAGATDYLKKPTKLNSLQDSVDYLNHELLSKIHSLTSPIKKTKIDNEKPVAKPQSSEANSSKRSNFAEVVVIAISTGGPSTLANFIPQLPEDVSVPIFIVQHMPREFTRLLAERLNKNSPLKIVEAADNMKVEPGYVYIAPGEFHMTVVGKKHNATIKLNQNEPENGCRPAADPLFRSVAEIYKDKTLAIVMTGMGHDGTKGAEVIKKNGGGVYSQDQESCVVYGMPQAVVQAGVVDEVVKLSDLPTAILNAIKII